MKLHNTTNRKRSCNSRQEMKIKGEGNMVVKLDRYGGRVIKIHCEMLVCEQMHFMYSLQKMTKIE